MPENAKPQLSPDAGHIPITEELDRAKWTLPPVLPVVIALLALGAVIAVVAYSNRPTPVASGNITKVLSSDQQGNVLVAVHLNFRNDLDKSLWVREINSEVETADGQKYTDKAAPAVDLDRYLRGAPELAEGKIDPLKADTKIPAHSTQNGMVIFAYPVAKTVFDARKAYTIRLDFFDHPAITLKAPPGT